MAQCTHLPPLLTENNIHNWVGETHFARGLHYVNDGLVLPHSQSGNRVTGWCLPRAGTPGCYYVWARLRGLRISDAQCTCPVGQYGICPHVAALLIDFIRKPQKYQRSMWQRLKLWSFRRQPESRQNQSA